MLIEAAGLIGLYETVTYTPADGEETSLSAIFVPVEDDMPLDGGVYETRAQTAGFLIAAELVAELALTHGVDRLTRANGEVWTIMRRGIGTGGFYRYECALDDIQGAHHRGRYRR